MQTKYQNQFHQLAFSFGLIFLRVHKNSCWLKLSNFNGYCVADDIRLAYSKYRQRARQIDQTSDYNIRILYHRILARTLYCRHFILISSIDCLNRRLSNLRDRMLRCLDNIHFYDIRKSIIHICALFLFPEGRNSLISY